ncbi:MAG: methyl-accepting chemotaxis protein [Proteobacteria bacterium]|nr:methyl-accepting chemotaxis protein [Pseudomonadota bacterium]
MSTSQLSPPQSSPPRPAASGASRPFLLGNLSIRAKLLLMMMGFFAIVASILYIYVDQSEIANQKNLLIFSSILILLGVGFTLFVARTVAGPIVDLTNAVQQLSADYLDTRIAVRSTDEVGKLANAFNELAERLQGAREAEQASRENEQRAREAVVDTSEKLLETSSHILTANTAQASGAQQQVAAVTEAVATVNEVHKTAEEAAKRANMVSESSRNALEVGKSGRESIELTIASMGSIKEHVESIAQEILALAERAQAIGDIVTTVNEIAEQTNLLALNAAIEASRAGEHGRGFSVVAIEVKELASQSKKATAQIRQILTQIQKATNGAVMATEIGTKKVAEAVQVVHGTGDNIRTLVTTVEEAAEAAAQIAASAGQQASGITHINLAMRNINQVASENLSSTEQAAQAARDLNELAETLRELLAS